MKRAKASGMPSSREGFTPRNASYWGFQLTCWMLYISNVLELFPDHKMPFNGEVFDFLERTFPETRGLHD